MWALYCCEQCIWLEHWMDCCNICMYGVKHYGPLYLWSSDESNSDLLAFAKLAFSEVYGGLGPSIKTKHFVQPSFFACIGLYWQIILWHLWVQKTNGGVRSVELFILKEGFGITLVKLPCFFRLQGNILFDSKFSFKIFSLKT